MSITRRLLLIVLSAGLGALVFPPVAWSWLAVVAWIPFFVAIQGVKASKALYLGLLHGMIFFGITFSWLISVFAGNKTMVVPLVLILSLFIGLFARGYALAYLHYQRGGEVDTGSSGKSIGKTWMMALFAAFWWGALEFFRCEVFALKFPWMTPGVGLGPIWLSPILGMYGISFFIVLGGVLLSLHGKMRFVGGGILLVMLASSLMRPSAPSIEHPVRVMALQSELADIDTLIDLTESKPSNVDLIIWPEYGIPMDVRRYPVAWTRLRELSKKREAVMVVGTQTKVDENTWYNTALTIDGDEVIGEHYKNHTVHFFNDGKAGTESSAVLSRLGKIGTPICFDCDFEDVVRKMVRDGAEFLAVPSMDAEHWTAREHRQHAELFRHRAAENHRWMVVSSTSGVTQIIDPYGNCVASLPLMDEGVLVGEIGRNTSLTVYTRWGWMFPWFVMFGGGVWMILLIFQRIIYTRKLKRQRRL